MNDTIINEFNNLNVNKLLQLVQSMETNCNHPSYFSNKNNSKASSMGVYKTEKTYHGRHGLSLQLEGLDRGFNDNAASRAVVMHGGWYVEENFIKKYGRAGRSWGCPAVPDTLSESIINTIKDNSLFVMYYPNDNWLLKSKFQHCKSVSPLINVGNLQTEIKPLTELRELREDVLFADINTNKKQDDSDAIVVMSADNYALTFHTKAPLSRMLRRQINNTEYIALSDTEFHNLVTTDNKEGLNALCFVTPVVKMVRGYYVTEMNIVTLGKIEKIEPSQSVSEKIQPKRYTVHFEQHPVVSLKSTDRFIRWLGL